MKTVAEHLAHHSSMCGRHTVARMDDEIHAAGARKAAEVLENKYGGSHPGISGAVDDPLTSKGEKIMNAMKEEYGSDKGKEVFYASANKGKITGVHDAGVVSGEVTTTPTGLAGVRGMPAD